MHDRFKPSRRLVLAAPWLLAGTVSAAAQGNLQNAGARPLRPPVADRRPARLRHHGIERTDDYAWLKAENWRAVLQDVSALAPDIRAHLDAENAYADAVLAPLAGMRATLLAELKGRIEPHESGVPAPDGAYAYWTRYQPGAEHYQIVRSQRDGSGEEVLLDGNILAAGKPFFSIGSFAHSFDHRLYAYTIDDQGAESFNLFIRDLASGVQLAYRLENVSDFTWTLDSRHIVYARRDAEHRPRLVFIHAVGSDPGTDRLIYEESDPAFEVGAYLTQSRRFLAISTGNNDATECWLLDSRDPFEKPRLIAPRRAGMRYYVNDWGDDLVIRTNAGGAADFKIVTAPAASPSEESWRDLVPHRAGRQLVGMLPFAEHLATLEYEDGLPGIVVRRRDGSEAHSLSFTEQVYSLGLTTGFEFETRSLRFSYSSPGTPNRVYDYDMDTRERVLRKQDRIPSGHDPSQYVVQRLFAPAPDGETVPVTVLRKRTLALDGTAPLYMEGYGAYADIFPAAFDPNVISLVDRGFVYAIAHVRGGREKGARWREQGRLANKSNTFTDFIACAEHLVRSGYTAAGRIVARGDSAGGLLVGAVANMRPDLFAGIVARVPFVDALNTMLDKDLPLSASDIPEWGDAINDPQAFRTILSYSPYDNVRGQNYPRILAIGSISDSRVTYWEPAKWVAKLRAHKTDDRTVALVTQMSAGHGGASGRYASLDEIALIYAFVLDCVGRA